MSKQNSTTESALMKESELQLPSSLYDENCINCPECNNLTILRPSLNEYQDIKYAFCTNFKCRAGGHLWECHK